MSEFSAGKISVRIIRRILFVLLSVSYFLQVPFRELSAWIGIFAFLFFLANFKNWIRSFANFSFCVYGAFVSICIFVSAFNSFQDVSKIFRFTEILFVVPCFFCMDDSDDGDFFSKAFVRIAFLKAIVIFVIYGAVLKSGNFGIVRNYASMKNWGDVYSLGSIFLTRVQVHGNALLVMACFVAFYRRDKFFYKTVLFLSCLIAGNKAFLIGLFLFFLYFVFKWIFREKRKCIFYLKFVLILISAALSFMPVFCEVNSILKEKSVYSNVVRKEQAEVLLSGNFVTGNGVGNYVRQKTSTRNYDGSNYFELQTLYIINQIGIAGYFLFLIVTFGFLLRKKKSYFLCYVYFSYLAYSFFNPYCFDTTHMIVGFLLCSVFSSRRKIK